MEYCGWLTPRGRYIHAVSSHWSALPKRLRDMGDGCIPSFTDMGWVWLNNPTPNHVWFECNKDNVALVKEFIHHNSIISATIAIVDGYKQTGKIEL